MQDFKEHKELTLFLLSNIFDLLILYLFLDYITIKKAIIILFYLFFKLFSLKIMFLVFDKFYGEKIGSEEYYE